MPFDFSRWSKQNMELRTAVFGHWWFGDLTKLQQHRKVFVPGTVLETQDFKLVSFVLNNLKLWIFVDLSIQFCPLLLPSITLPTPFTRARPFQGPSNTSSPRNLNTQILTTFNPWSPMVVVVNRYGRPGLWIVKEKQKRKRKEQGPHDLTTTRWPLWQTGRGPIAAADALAVENRIFGNSLKLQKISVSSLKSVNRSQAELWHGTTLYIIFFRFFSVTIQMLVFLFFTEQKRIFQLFSFCKIVSLLRRHLLSPCNFSHIQAFGAEAEARI